jgi:hypothetical protein
MLLPWTDISSVLGIDRTHHLFFVWPELIRMAFILQMVGEKSKQK